MSKLKLVKLPGHPDAEDLDYWNDRFCEKEPSQEELERAGIVVEKIDWGAETDESIITLIKVGNKDYKPTVEELEEWRKVFEEAQGDSDFKIFTHDAVEIDRIKIEEEKPTMIITGPYRIIR